MPRREYGYKITEERKLPSGVVLVFATITGLGIDERGVYLVDLVQKYDGRPFCEVEVVTYTDGEYNIKYYV